MGQDHSITPEVVADLSEYEPTPEISSAIAVEEQRAIAEVQAMATLAKRFPRNRAAAVEQIVRECGRRAVAESALYAYPRGDSVVKGPTVHLMRMIATAWQNVDSGVREVGRTDDATDMIAYAWDLEANRRRSIRWTVPRWIRLRDGRRKAINDPRDVYELNANMGARRERACLQHVIPRDVVDLAISTALTTKASAVGSSLPERIDAMVIAFGQLSVPVEAIEKRLGHGLDLCTVEEIVDLQIIYRSIKDGEVSRLTFFDLGKGARSDDTDELTEAFLPSEPVTAPASDDNAPEIARNGVCNAPDEGTPYGTTSENTDAHRASSRETGAKGRSLFDDDDGDDASPDAAPTEQPLAPDEAIAVMDMLADLQALLESSDYDKATYQAWRTEALALFEVEDESDLNADQLRGHIRSLDLRLREWSDSQGG
jgi:hypothetical protein